MKKITKALFFTMFAFSLSMNAQKHKHGEGKIVFGQSVSPNKISPDGHIRCATDEYENYLRAINPQRETAEQFEAWMAKKIQEQNAIGQVASQSGGIIYIPVVVHVIHNGDAYGVNENITDEQVQSQITVMTQDFRRMAGTPGFNSNAVGADVQVEFVLAKVDPNGNPTNGINRVNLCQDSWSTGDIDGVVKPTTIWDPAQYMNMWSVNFSDATLLGYAQFPESTLGGLSTAAQSANTDGVVAGYRFFGSSAITTGDFQAPYDRGRTMTHEVGHFLGLRHIWGDNNTCPNTNVATNKDFVADTPAANAPNFECPVGNDSCPSNPGNDMIENYMDYTDDTCMNIFTLGQKTRITTVMNNSPRRSTLKTSVKDIAIALFANDAEVLIENACAPAVTATCANPNPPVTIPLKKVLLYNRGNANMTSATLSYNINGGTAYTNNWTGNLAPNKYAEITLANTAVNGTLNVSITAVNGGTDQRASNNTASKVFSPNGAATLPYFNYTTFTFNLVGDAFGSETTWNLKNAAGTTLYSGGPYTDLTAAGTQNLVTNQTWNLPANGCYYLTVNDSWGDGITPGYGSGYFTVTANGGAVSVVNNTAFSGPGGNVPTSTVHYFTNNATLATDSFEMSDAVTVYPNPATTELNIKFASGFSGAFKYSIMNSIGQVVKSAAVTTQDGLKVNTAGFSNGVYFIKIEQDGKSKTVKFIKN